MYRISMSRVVTQLPVDSTRGCAVIVKAVGHNDIILIGVGMPCDNIMQINECT